ncbi:hypothetical protein FPV67DRAFT_816637 [Lyophyllum atratum]|nr:hypothetical protein FPV67DRAFT_816637 [Lyophyllum atratum]
MSHLHILHTFTFIHLVRLFLGLTTLEVPFFRPQRRPSNGLCIFPRLLWWTDTRPWSMRSSLAQMDISFCSFRQCRFSLHASGHTYYDVNVACGAAPVMPFHIVDASHQLRQSSLVGVINPRASLV